MTALGRRLKAQPAKADQQPTPLEPRILCEVFFLDKIRNVRYIFPLTESLSCSPKDGREDGKP
jgi:hypothetical protein